VGVWGVPSPATSGVGWGGIPHTPAYTYVHISGYYGKYGLIEEQTTSEDSDNKSEADMDVEEPMQTGETYNFFSKFFYFDKKKIFMFGTNIF